MDVITIATPEALRALTLALGEAAAIGVDTEADSFFAYREKTCLIQISTATDDYLVDPIAIPDLSPLGPTFANPAISKVFHAAENDVAALRRDFGIQTRGLFDTMVSARIMGLPHVGLGDLLREHYGVATDKRLQRYPWSKRPLDEVALRYAVIDSHYLLPLADLLRGRLQEAARLDEAREEFVRLESSTATERRFDPESFWRIKGAYGLTPRQRAILRELHIWRDQMAAARDRPPFRVIPDAALLALALGQPQDRGALDHIPSVPAAVVQRSAPALLMAIQRGLTTDPPTPPVSRRPDEDVLARYEALRRWRRQTALQRGVEPDVIVSNAALQLVAERQPRTADHLATLGVLGPWKLRTYGPTLLHALWAGADDGPAPATG